MHEGFEPDVSLWQPWTAQEVFQRLRDVREPWYIAGGLAIDLFLGRATREHEDIEIGVPAAAFDSFRPAFADCDLFAVGSGKAHALDAQSESLLAKTHQTWVRDRATGAWRLDILREPSDGATWIARRHADVRLGYRDLIMKTPSGVPYACPEVVLLFKAKARRAKDEADFDNVLPAMSAAARRWLSSALERAHPGHAWLARLHR
jgi:hypothetical protein